MYLCILDQCFCSTGGILSSGFFYSSTCPEFRSFITRERISSSLAQQ